MGKPLEGKKTRCSVGPCRAVAIAICAIPLSLLPVVAGAVETDRITVEDPGTGAIKFKVTSEGNVTGAALTVQQGQSEAASAIMLKVNDQSGAVKFAVQADGAVAIGAPSAPYPLTIDSGIASAVPAGVGMVMLSGKNNKERIELRSFGPTDSSGAVIQGKAAQWISGVPTSTQTNHVLFGLGGSGYDDLGNVVIANRGLFQIKAEENWGQQAQGTYMSFQTTASGTLNRAEKVRITGSGNVGIGVPAPLHRLEVAGTVKANTFIGDGSQLTNIPSGPTGPKGDTGATGPKGDIGETGPAGSDTQAQILTKLATKADGTVATGAPVVFDTSINTGAAGTATVIIQGNSNKERIELRSANAAIGQITPVFQAKGASGTIDSPAATPEGAVLFGLGGSGYDGTQWVTPNRALIGMKAAEKWNPASQGTFITFETTPIGSAGTAATRLERVRVSDIGNVGIGIPNPSQKLEVAGAIKISSSGTRPNCEDATRGTFWFTKGGAGVKDGVEVCAKDAADVSSWRTIY